jgi:TonB family protein
MDTNDLDRREKTRIDLPGDGLAGIVHPKRINRATIFPGWGPKVLGVAIALGTLGLSASHALASPSPTHPLSCAVRDRDATIGNHPIPEMPPLAQAANASGDVVVQVGLSADGELENATIVKSAQNAALDREALRVVGETQFVPEIVDCQSIPGTYLYTVSFQS